MSDRMNESPKVNINFVALNVLDKINFWPINNLLKLKFLLQDVFKNF